MSDYLFDAPWWAILLVFVAGMAIVWSGNKRLDKTLKILGIIVIGAAIVWTLLSYFIDTNKEITIKQTRQFVQAVVKRDSATIKLLLHPKATIGMWNRDDIVIGAKSYAELYGLKAAHIMGIDGEDHQTQITVNFAVFSEHDSAHMPVTAVNSRWQFEWWRTTDGWRLKNIIPTAVGTQDASESTEKYFLNKPKPKYDLP